MSKKETETHYVVEPVSELPRKRFPVKAKVYDDIIKDVLSRPKGHYKIDIPNKKPSSVYQVLAKRIKMGSVAVGKSGKEYKVEYPLKIHFINKTVYIEKL